MLLRNTIFFLIFLVTDNAMATNFPTSERAQKSIALVEDSLRKQLKQKELEYGSSIFIRIFKLSSKLEVWMKNSDGKYKLFKEYPICTFSGELGPKLKQGDRQSPEGFYFVNQSRLNPWSQFHLSFNLGYPNAYERFHGRTGSALMVHGNCVSIGCYAMTDPLINEIYALSVAALKAGQPFFRVHVFPFKLENKQLEEFRQHKWYSFWLNLQEGYDYFETHRVPPNVEVSNGRYVFGSSSQAD